MLAEGAETATTRAIQSILPLYRGQLSPVDPPRFAHPAEAQLAQVFSFYGIRWAYEPTTFALEWHPDGDPSEMFTPDFYLPDHRLYIELTTMRQRLVTRKNRKVRLLTQVYPNARIKLVYRRDFLRLVQTFRRAIASPAEAGIDAILWSEDEIRCRINAMASEIADVCAELSDAPVLVALGGGAVRWQRELRAALVLRGISPEIDHLRLARARRPQGFAHVRICRPPRAVVRDRPIILLTDVVSTGMSLRYVQDWLTRRSVTVVHTCALLDRVSARLVDVRIDSAAFTAPHELLAGYGLSLQPAHAHQPFIGVVRSLQTDAPVMAAREPLLQ
jgi:hypoxanthine phosphoribosyltransferase